MRFLMVSNIGVGSWGTFWDIRLKVTLACETGCTRRQVFRERADLCRKLIECRHPQRWKSRWKTNRVARSWSAQGHKQTRPLKPEESKSAPSMRKDLTLARHVDLAIATPEPQDSVNSSRSQGTQWGYKDSLTSPTTEISFCIHHSMGCIHHSMGWSIRKN
jgi:hypothetical protein